MLMMFRSFFFGFAAFLAVTFAARGTEDGTAGAEWMPTIPDALIGPYIADPRIVTVLDAPGTNCASAGQLNFNCLVYSDYRSGAGAPENVSNPFMLPVFTLVKKTVASDISSLRKHAKFGGDNMRQLDTGFLTYGDARIELVGLVNRMDRQFNRDTVVGRGRPEDRCGEISAIYRFGYEGNLEGADVTGDRKYQSRLPVTMNVVFPAAPWSGETGCQEVARRWLGYVNAVKAGAGVSELLPKAQAIAGSLHAGDIDRIELNMQGSRVPAGADSTDFGTLGTYIIRVFRWTPGNEEGGGRWKASYLTNQIDRARFFDAKGDENTCGENKNKKLDRTRLVEFLLSINAPGEGPNGVGDVDSGLINIPQEFLACRAISISPGGSSRSGNLPFWSGKTATEVIITDKEISDALKRYRAKGFTLGFVGSADEFRTRLNDATCSGCHQTRAIAGFHFPGADRFGTSPVNSVYLPGSPHFFGD